MRLHFSRLDDYVRTEFSTAASCPPERPPVMMAMQRPIPLARPSGSDE